MKRKNIAKKIMSITMASTMVTSFAAGAFADVEGTTTKEAAVLDSIKYINGYPDGSFKPNNGVQRAEIAKMVALIEGLAAETEVGFSDVTEDHWAKGFIASVRKAGVIKGDENGNFNPNKGLTRAELATIIDRLIEETDSETELSEKELSDISGHWGEESIKRVASLGIINGYPDGSFKPDAEVTRAETVKLLNGLQGIISVDESIDGIVETSFEDAKGTWAEKHILAASNEFKYVLETGGKLVVVAEETEEVLEKEIKNISVKTDSETGLTTVTAEVFNFEEGETAKIVLKDKDGKAVKTVEGLDIVEVVTEDEVAAEDKKANSDVLENINDAIYGGTSTDPVDDEENTSEEENATEEEEKNIIKRGVVSYTFESELESGELTAEVSVGDVKVESEKVVITKLEVAKVEVKSATQVKVVFNKVVDKTTASDPDNYKIKVAGVNFVPTSNIRAELQDDGKTVILTDASDTSGDVSSLSNIVANNQSYQVEIDGVLTKGFLPMEKSTSPLAVFKDEVSPAVLKTEANGSTLRVYFNEPVSLAGVTAKIDGIATDITGAVSRVVGEDNYIEVPLTDEQRKAGDHEVILYDVADTLGNAADVLTKGYKVVLDTTAPKIVSVKEKGMYSFEVEFSEELSPSLQTGNITIKKGSLVLNVSSITKNLLEPTKYTVVVADRDADNPVYEKEETKVALTVEIEGYRDTSDIIGEKTVKTITLSEDKVAPTIVHNAINKGKETNELRVVFSEDLDLSYATDGAVDGKVVVKKNGVIITTANASNVIADAEGNLRVLNVALGETITDGVYTIEIAEGAVRDIAKNENAAVSTSVTYKSSTAKLTPTLSVISANTYQIAFDGSVDMTDSAITAGNYTIDGKALPAGTKISFFGDKQTVKIELPLESTANSSTGLLKISKNVKNVEGVAVVADVDTGKEITLQVPMADNVKPALVGVKYLVANSTDTATNKLRLEFSEAMGIVSNLANAKDDIEVVVNGTKQTIVNIETGVDGNKYLVVTLSGNINLNQSVAVNTIDVKDQDTAQDIKDAQGNDLKSGGSVKAVGSAIDVAAINQMAAALADKAALEVSTTGGEALSAVATDLVLPVSGANGSVIEYSVVDLDGVVSGTGVVTVPGYNPAESSDKSGKIVAKITNGTAVVVREFDITVAANGVATVGTADVDSTGAVSEIALSTLSIAVNDSKGLALEGLVATDFTAGEITNLTGDLVGKTLAVSEGVITIDGGLLAEAAGTFDIVLTDAIGNSITVTVTVAKAI